MSERPGNSVQAAYDYCRLVAKREAKNFYYAFRVLPKRKSDAICAVYAFMRRADDIADDESLSVEARREQMSRWTGDRRSSRSSPSDDPVFVALKDAQQHFGISDDLLEQLVAGTTMDLYETAGTDEASLSGRGGKKQTLQVYRTFPDLYRYCYLVASVVGLVCIRIFGYSDERAEKYAEETGIAFQLTNILRDVVEDASRGRVYLPLDDMREEQLSLDEWVENLAAHQPSDRSLALMLKEIRRAEEYYRSADKLIPLLDPDSRSAMHVLAQIYRELLIKIAAEPTAVFQGRVSLSTTRKLTILARGMVGSAWARGRL